MKPSNYYLPVAAFTVGAAVMAIEMTASRVLAPHFGASFFVWTALIVTVLLSMSLGYWYGGRLAARLTERATLGFLLCGAAGLLLVGLWGSYGLSSGITLLLLSMGGAAGALFVGALLMTLVLFSLPVFILAMTSPIIVRLWSAGSEDVGAVAGRYFALSTIGSVVGTVLPSVLLVPLFGVQTTFMVVAAALAILGLPVLTAKFRLAVGLVLLGALALLLIQSADSAPGVIYQEESPYQLIRVKEIDGARYLTFNEGSGIQSVLFPEQERTFMYYDHLVSLPLLARQTSSEQPRTAILGLACGTSVRQLMAGLPPEAQPDITGVEIDPSVVQVARDFFTVEELPVQIAVEDGRTFLLHDRQPFDLIFIDAYSTQMYIPAHMVSQEFFRLARENLTEGGLVAMNVNATQEDSRILQAITNTTASVFPFVYLTKAGSTWNWLVVGSNQPLDYGLAAANLPEEYLDIGEPLRQARQVTFNDSEPVLTDDWAPIEMMTDSMIITDTLRRLSES